MNRWSICVKKGVRVDCIQMRVNIIIGRESTELQLIFDFINQLIDFILGQTFALKIFACFIDDGKPQILLLIMFRFENSDRHSGCHNPVLVRASCRELLKILAVGQLRNISIEKDPGAIVGLSIDQPSNTIVCVRRSARCCRCCCRGSATSIIGVTGRERERSFDRTNHFSCSSSKQETTSTSNRRSAIPTVISKKAHNISKFISIAQRLPVIEIRTDYQSHGHRKMNHFVDLPMMIHNLCSPGLERIELVIWPQIWLNDLFPRRQKPCKAIESGIPTTVSWFLRK